MIHFITGKPGGGKSFLAVEKFVLSVLIHDTRTIVTTLPLLMGGIAEELLRRGSNVNPFQRIRIIDDDEAKQFYRYRSPDLPELELSEDPNNPGLKPNQDVGGGVVYVIDEAHIPFNSHKWQSIGENVIWYASQHRKFADDLILITQYVDNVAKQLRVLAQDYTVVRNRRKERYGMFSLGKGFEYYIYLQKPTGAVTDKPAERHTLELDVKGVGSCYDTAAGVGIRGLGSGADKNDKPKGMPLWTLWAGFALCMGLLLFAVRSLPKWLHQGEQTIASKVVGGEKQSQTSDTSSSAGLASLATPPKPETGSNSETNQGPKPWTVTELQIPYEPPMESLWVTGWVMKGNSINVVLSNGVVITDRDAVDDDGQRNPFKGISRVERNYVEFGDGLRLPIGKPNEGKQSQGTNSIDGDKLNESPAGQPASLPEFTG